MTSLVPDGWTELQPGIYDTGGGALHVNIPQLLADRGIEATPEAIDASARNIVKAMEDLGLDVKVQVVE